MKILRIKEFVSNVLLIIILFFLSVFLVLLYSSPGEIKQILDGDGHMVEHSLAEKISVDIKNTKMGMIIESENIDNPVLLFVHGGPGLPEYFMNETYVNSLKSSFTVVWWDQRGSGLSYNSKISPDDMTADQMVTDTIDVTHYLKERFGKDKIYLLGHSWGSFVAIQAAKKAPELYYAYIGMSQICNQLESEKIAYHYMVEQYEMQGNTKMMSKLNKYAADEGLSMPGNLRDQTMHELGIGTTYKMRSVVKEIFMPVMKSKAYTWIEKINIWRGKISSRNYLFNNVLTTDLTNEITSLDIPVYFWSGIHDYTVNYQLSKDYLNQLDAPTKGFYTFDLSAHSPLFEEPEKALDILIFDVLQNKTLLAD